MYTLDGSAKAGKGYQAMTQVRKKYFPYAGADNLKRATSMCLCHGVLKDQFIFGTVLARI